MAKVALEVKASVGRTSKIGQVGGNVGDLPQSYLVRLAVTNKSDKTMYIVASWPKEVVNEQSHHLILDFREPFRGVVTTHQFPGLTPIMPGRTEEIDHLVPVKHALAHIAGSTFKGGRAQTLNRIARLTCHIPYSDQPFPRKDADSPSAKTIESWKKGTITRVFSGDKIGMIQEGVGVH
jgi:hypothetical protein